MVMDDSRVPVAVSRSIISARAKGIRDVDDHWLTQIEPNPTPFPQVKKHGRPRPRHRRFIDGERIGGLCDSFRSYFRLVGYSDQGRHQATFRVIRDFSATGPAVGRYSTEAGPCSAPFLDHFLDAFPRVCSWPGVVLLWGSRNCRMLEQFSTMFLNSICGHADGCLMGLCLSVRAETPGGGVA